MVSYESSSLNSSMGTNNSKDILNNLKNFKKVLLTLHKSPDGDSLASNTAFKYFLEQKLKIQATLVSPDPLPDYLNDLPISQEIDEYKDISEINLLNFDALIALDSSSPSQLSAKVKNFTIPPNIFVINIDHHATNTSYGNINHIDSSTSSCGEVIANLISDNNITIDKNLALRLLVGICSDTECFRFGTTPKLLKTVASLIQTGVKFDKDIINPLFFNQSFKYKKFQGLVLSNLKFNPQKQFAYSTVSITEWQSLGLQEHETGGTSNLVHDLGGALFIFVLVERSDGVHGSFRSRQGIDVSIFAKDLGGGGHKPAAGFTLYNLGLKEAEQKVFETIEKLGVIKSGDD